MISAPDISMIASQTRTHSDTPGTSLRGGMESFSSVWSRAQRNETPEQTARASAEEFVSIALVQPILSQLRESNMAAEPFGPSDVERQFGPLLDGEISMRIVKAQGFDLVDRLARDLLKYTGASQASGTPGAELVDEVV